MIGEKFDRHEPAPVIGKPAGQLLPTHDNPVAARFSSSCIAFGRRRDTVGMRMIMADRGRSAVARSAVYGDQRGRIDLEIFARIAGDVTAGSHSLHLAGAAQQQAADFRDRTGMRLGTNIVEQGH